MKTPSVLVVENDPLLTQSLKNHCKHKGIPAHFTGKLTAALDLIEQEKFSVVVVDRMLDDGDGIELVEYLHDISPQTKVIVCSNMGSEHDRIYGLETGADAYLSKPFSFSEFSLILEKLLRVHKQIESHVLRAGAVVLHTSSGVVTIGNCTKQLRKKETQLLACLMIHKNTVVSRNDLIEYVWGITDSQPNYNTLDVYIRRIRMSFGKDHAHFIQTKRGFGYLLRI
ncbi:MAG: response regulator transcription factor [Pseudomonadales bacterium]|nr:response regulator transcription factor [Candidatus Woesebacteria bacterium]MCB9800859.1 response regulator transcription factor [Pseudomonadales bacterium]